MAKVVGSGSTIPKYTIRVALIWLIPFLSAIFGGFLLVPFLLAACLTPIELPKVRQRLLGARARKQLPCLKAPALMRLAALWVLQVWWLILWRASQQDAPTEYTQGYEEAGEIERVAWTPRSMSVVLPCAGEGEYALKTVQAVFDSLPPELLREIIVVDDGSVPPLTETFLSSDVRAQYRVQVIRHERTMGLISAKKDGGDAASGDILVFFDCHVAPQTGWYKPFVRLIGANFRRIVVPKITDLDPGTWKQRGGGGNAMAKCYLTWDADFKWFQSSDPYVPVVSGGLLGISKRWWNETGGYDEHMRGWGGENLDQSLRTWLCGGEIVVADDSLVAHMWRVPSDPRTAPRYTVDPEAANINRLRAAVAWFGEFSEKLHEFPAMQYDRMQDGKPWYGDISNILEVKRRLNCKSFAWFIRRFRNVYEDGGLVPKETFGLRSSVGECLTFNGASGTSPSGFGGVSLRPCDEADDRQRWHGANRDPDAEGQPCCSGLRAWNTDQCVTATGSAIATAVCELSGVMRSQRWQLSSEGYIQRATGGFMGGHECLEAQGDKLVVSSSCDYVWSKDNALEPIESELYRKALEQELDSLGGIAYGEAAS